MDVFLRVMNECKRSYPFLARMTRSVERSGQNSSSAMLPKSLISVNPDPRTNELTSEERSGFNRTDWILDWTEDPDRSMVRILNVREFFA
jgi:hypothetical protein